MGRSQKSLAENCLMSIMPKTPIWGNIFKSFINEAIICLKPMAVFWVYLLQMNPDQIVCVLLKLKSEALTFVYGQPCWPCGEAPKL